MDPASVSENASRRTAQISRMLLRASTFPNHTGKCSRCGILHRLCICASVDTLMLPCRAIRHNVTILVHPRELARASSTHRILLRLGRSRAVPWLAPGSETIADVYELLQQQCKLSGQVPVVLYPGPKSLSPAELLRRLSPAQQKAGLSLLVLDGTWSETRQMAKDMPQDAVLLGLGPQDIISSFSLFQGLRRQPHPNRISTSEAVTSALEALYGAEPGHSDAQVKPFPPSETPPLLHDQLLPATPYLPCRRLRLALAHQVDAMSLQHGLLDPGVRTGDEAGRRGMRGAGYRTWTLGHGAGPFLGKLPAWLLERIAVYAYGRENVEVGSYRVRKARGVKLVEWSAERGRSEHALGMELLGLSGAVAEGTERGYFGNAPGRERADSSATPMVDLSGPWLKSRFPTASVYTRIALALVSKDLIEWAAGGRRKRRCHAAHPTTGWPALDASASMPS